MAQHDPFDSSKYSIDRAKHHTSNFKTGLKAFRDSNPYVPVLELEPETGDRVLKIKGIRQIPENLKGDVSDAAINLRSALDQAVFAITKKKNSFFPIGGREKDVDNAINGRLVKYGVPTEISALIRGFKPYKGGNDILWALNEVAGSNKHGIIAPVAVNWGCSWQGMRIVGGPYIIGQSNPWDSTKNEVEISRFGAGVKFYSHSNFQATIVIGIDKIEIIKGYPSDGVLDNFIRVVESVVLALEAEAIRIGIV